MLHTGRARALAKLGRTQETLTAIGAADEQFAHADSTEAPSHVRWYDAAEHAGETGHALATLATGGGRFTGEATTRLRAAIIGYPASYVRARTFAQIGLATVLMSAGDPREAATPRSPRPAPCTRAASPTPCATCTAPPPRTRPSPRSPTSAAPSPPPDPGCAFSGRGAGRHG
jgi:hypothetical protein